MYSSRFVNDNGYSFDLSLDNNIIFNIDPLSELDVDIGASQGYDQIGETVDSLAVMGVTREIRGVIMGEAAEKKNLLLRAFAPRTHGRLIFNDKYYAECYIKKTPAIQPQNRDAGFSLMIFCPYPYWSDINERTQELGTWEKAFSFPVLYDTHTFGTRTSGSFISVFNHGNAPTYYTITFTSTADVDGYGILNVTTDEYIFFYDILSPGQTVTMERRGGRIYASKTAGGETVDMIFALEYMSNFYELAVGENVIKLIAGDDNELALSAIIVYRDVYTGVYDGM